LNYIGSYYLKLDGAVDALVFAGMIGEKSKELRDVVARKVQCLGFVQLDVPRNEALNELDGVVLDVGVAVAEGSGRGRRLLVCRTDEQLEMARACALDDTLWKD